jgi:hypothetical protein
MKRFMYDLRVDGSAVSVPAGFCVFTPVFAHPDTNCRISGRRVAARPYRLGLEDREGGSQTALHSAAILEES